MPPSARGIWGMVRGAGSKLAATEKGLKALSKVGGLQIHKRIVPSAHPTAKNRPQKIWHAKQDVKKAAGGMPVKPGSSSISMEHRRTQTMSGHTTASVQAHGVDAANKRLEQISREKAARAPLPTGARFATPKTPSAQDVRHTERMAKEYDPKKHAEISARADLARKAAQVAADAANDARLKSQLSRTTHTEETHKAAASAHKVAAANYDRAGDPASARWHRQEALAHGRHKNNLRGGWKPEGVPSAKIAEAHRRSERAFNASEGARNANTKAAHKAAASSHTVAAAHYDMAGDMKAAQDQARLHREVAAHHVRQADKKLKPDYRGSAIAEVAATGKIAPIGKVEAHTGAHGPTPRAAVPPTLAARWAADVQKLEAKALDMERKFHAAMRGKKVPLANQLAAEHDALLAQIAKLKR